MTKRTKSIAATSRFVCLIHEEIIAASKALRRVNEMPKDAPKADVTEACRQALAACYVALAHAADAEEGTDLNFGVVRMPKGMMRRLLR